jgi:hypothetical protein
MTNLKIVDGDTVIVLEKLSETVTRIVKEKDSMANNKLTRKPVTPRMMEYLRNVIDTPTVGAYGDNGKAPDEIIGQKMFVTRERVTHYRKKFAKLYTKEEILELCEEIMKEAA